MPVLNTAVILWAWGTPVAVEERSFYERYFFDQITGQAAYWLKQSAGTVLVTGKVFDWIFDARPNPDFTARGAVADLLIEHMEDEHDVDFSDYDCIVVVLGLPQSKMSDGGSVTGRTDDGGRHAIVMRAEDPFDFVTHELGHALGLAHSFTFDEGFHVVGENPGGYGHPHCIMSAMVYGNKQSWAQHDAAPPLDAHRQYRKLGPSLNGLTALSRGWIAAPTIDLAPGQELEVELRSRQWLGLDPALPPQGVQVRKPDGSTYVVEFYENRDWDQSLPGNMLVVTQDKGGLADRRYPDQHSGTYLGSLQLPASLTGPGGVLNVPGRIGLIPLSYDSTGHSLRVKLVDGVAAGGIITMNATVSTATSVANSASVTFNPGDRFCVTGTWTYQLVENSQTIVVEATHPRAHDGTKVKWSLDGVPLDHHGFLSITKTVSQADPKRLDVTALTTIVIDYRVDAIPNGSRLTLKNRPQDESFGLDVAAAFQTSVAAATATTIVEFTGRECRFPQDFADRYAACMREYTSHLVEGSQIRVVIDQDQINRIPGSLHIEVPGWLSGLAHSLSIGDQAGFELAASALRQHVGIPDLRLITFDMKGALRIDPTSNEITFAAHGNSVTEGGGGR